MNLDELKNLVEEVKTAEVVVGGQDGKKGLN